MLGEADRFHYEAMERHHRDPAGVAKSARWNTPLLVALSAFVLIGYLVSQDAGWVAFAATSAVAAAAMLAHLITGRFFAASPEPAKLAVSFGERHATLLGLVAKLREVRTGDPTFADDLERIRAEQPPMPENPWVS